MVANPTRDRLNRENDFSLSPFVPEDFSLARQVRPSRPVSARSSLHTQAELLTRFLQLSATTFTYYICMVTHIASVWINRMMLPILLVVS